ncbi:Prolyl oligopeptidase family protein [Prosthecobacter debontii]|uniref:Prolyl oligopeptidase family protein n=1 Tax=Prosthecobacter debontii TaxID=48467 RepID=A0A1T4Y5U2_9BACT|nr:prolyl oligopeptidase family serine peptidase [Prosthecobacter debontii]SKA97177.1 Prolyl oligopeptidase family protein [Prosthecobacter debontii]
MFRSFFFAFGFILSANATEPVLKGWQPEVRRIEIQSSVDQSLQPALTWSPASKETQPLLVGLHTWSGDYTQASNGRSYAQWCMDRGWHFIYPHFRGPNRTPESMGSDLAVQDIVDAVEQMKKTQRVDTNRIYLIGVSGGGHMAMLMAGRHPEIWAGVSAWCGISDIAAWHNEHLTDGTPDNYARNIEQALGGRPTAERLEDARKRSPLTHLAQARNVPLDINHGIHDGRVGSVPFRHGLFAFNKVATEPLAPTEISAYYESQQRPSNWTAPDADALYVGLPLKKPGMSAELAHQPVSKPVLFRKVSGNARITLFDGGHEILYAPALNWLALQRKGQAAVWQISNPLPVGPEADTQSGL